MSSKSSFKMSTRCLILKSSTTLYSHISRHAQYEHPCATQYNGLLNQQQGPYQGRPLQYTQQPHFTSNVLVPANPYLHEEIPIWLRVYFKASPSLDHHLKWDLFTLPELEGFEAMLNRLLRDELEELVMRSVIGSTINSHSQIKTHFASL